MKRRVEPVEVAAIAIWIATFGSAGLALIHGDWMLAGLIVSARIAIWWGSAIPAEAGYWILGLALYRAYSTGQDAVFFLAAFMAVLRNADLLRMLQIRSPGSAWTTYFLGPPSFRGWSALTYAWRRRGRTLHAFARTLAVAMGVAWTSGILWVAYDSHSLWRLPYLVVMSLFALWWLSLGVRALRDRSKISSAQ
jgi:hypothetical protein